MTQPGPALRDGLPQPRVRRHRTALIAAALITLAFGAGFGVAAATTSDQATTAAVPVAVPAPNSTAPTKHPAAEARTVRATIVSVSPATWTLSTRNGETLQVLVTASTKFGTASAPATAAQFAPGTAIIVTGTTANGTITATRIAQAAGPKTAAPQTTAPNPVPTSSGTASPTAAASAH